LDIVHKDEMILISKSALSPLRPGGSRYQKIVPLDEKTPYVDPVDPVKRPLVRAVQVPFHAFTEGRGGGGGGGCGGGGGIKRNRR